MQYTNDECSCNINAVTDPTRYTKLYKLQLKTKIKIDPKFVRNVEFLYLLLFVVVAAFRAVCFCVAV